ncbi:hypothetical protein V070_00210 [Staphylococcus aureus C0673]|nr:hypothetical protein V070_00210 [Staphylococcus aureus C0673]
MTPKFRAYLNMHKKIVDVQEINYKYKEIVWVNGKYTEVDNFVDIELLQSTGLFDKNGKEIFEGDIVKHELVPNPFISNAYFEIIQARSGEWRMDNYRGGQVLAFSNHEVEVVGNKFEHPHLLGEE